ncbi:MAG TPA: hypothetical protein VGQ83_13880 [Polyangia bacterium]|jgi:hypothetical protein
MADDPQPGTITRRRFLGGAVTLVCASPLVGPLLSGCSSAGAARPTRIDGWDVPPGTVLTPERFARLAALFDALVPGDEAAPGATQAHAAWYLDQLFGAFNVDPPRIFAGGPYSGRHGGLDGFRQFQPLTRVERIRWQTYLEGSRGIPAREFNGPVVGVIQQYEEQLDALPVVGGRRFTALDVDERRSVAGGLDEAFLTTAYRHAVEGTYSDPVYGGNFEGRGWAVIDYEGDRQPGGYTPHQIAHPEEG